MSLELLIFIILALVWIIASILELSYLYKFNLKGYTKGIVIHRKEIDVKFSNWNDFDGIYEDEEAKYVFIPDAKIGYFISRLRFYRQYSFFAHSYSLPFTIFGTFREENNKIHLEYRVSYRLLYLFIVILIPGILIPVIKGEYTEIGLGIFGILASSLILFITYLFKKNIMKIIKDETLNYLKVKTKIN